MVVVTLVIVSTGSMMLILDHHYYHAATIICLEKKLQTEYENEGLTNYKRALNKLKST